MALKEVMMGIEAQKGGGGTSPNVWYSGSARKNKLDPIRSKVLRKAGLKRSKINDKRGQVD